MRKKKYLKRALSYLLSATMLMQGFVVFAENTDTDENKVLTNVALRGIPTCYKGLNKDRPARGLNNGLIILGNDLDYAEVGMDTPQTKEDPYYVQIDLREEYDIEKLNLWRYYKDNRTYHDTIIFVSEDTEFTAEDIVYNSDTENFFGFGSGSDEEYAETAEGKEILLDTPKRGRYVRVINNGQTSGLQMGGHYVELQVWAPLSAEAIEQNNLRLWYCQSANMSGVGDPWKDSALPIGNGDIGANVYGEITNERIVLSEKTLWTGGPSEHRPDYDFNNKQMGIGKDGTTIPTSEIFKQVQEFFALHTPEGDKRASELFNQLVCDASTWEGGYQYWGNIYFKFKNIDENNVYAYSRDLDLKTAISGVEYSYNDTDYKREYFVSNPDNVMAVKFSASGKDKLNFDVQFKSSQGAVEEFTADSIIVKGELNDNQLKYDSELKVVNEGGTVTRNGDALTIENADAVVVYVNAVTDYSDVYPEYRTGETNEALRQKVSGTIDAAIEKGYDAVKEAHIEDYSNIFSRVDLDFGQAISSKPTNELFSNYKNGIATEDEKRHLEVLLYQFGRYMLISSSRENSKLPANLQGVWNFTNSPPWASDYHMNINLQMNYWPVYNSNMAECALPLIEYIDSLREPGRETARVYTGITSAKDPETGEYIEENGFMAHNQNTPFGFTAPGWEYNWGWEPAAVPWILQSCWEMYEYTEDKDILAEKIYPMLKETATFYEQYLIWDDVQNRYVSSPSFSPEHYRGPATVGCTFDQSIVWQLYKDTIEAAEALGVDADRIDDWKEIQSKLDPVQIGTDGQIKEWYDETSLNSIYVTEEDYRHISHLVGIFPGDLVSVETPEYLEAAIVSLTERGDTNQTGWSQAHRVTAWARTGDGEKAYSFLEDIMTTSTAQNLMGVCPWFQIDGNLGYTAGVAEMLFQSNLGYIDFLPALPDDWSEGSVHGLIARGNFELGIEWSENKADKFTITSKNGGECVAKYPGIDVANITDSKGNTVESTIVENDKVSFHTVQGETYTIHMNDLKSKLQAEYDKHVNYDSDDYTQESWAAFEKAMSEAKAVLDNPDAGEQSISDALTKLQEAVGNLEKSSVEEPVSKKTLEYFLNKAKEHVVNGDVEGCVESVQKLFGEAIAEGEAIMADVAATSEQVMAATAKLMTAIQALDFIAGDKTDLQMAADLGDMVDLSKYVKAGQKEFIDAMNGAKAVLADGDAMQEEVDDAWNVLVEAIGNLRLKADKSTLQSLLNEVARLNLNRYTEETVAAFKAALAVANDVMTNQELSEKEQKVVDDAVKALADARDALVVKSDGGNSDGEGNVSGNGNGNAGDNSTNDSSEKTNSNTVKTDDETLPVWMLWAMAACSVAIAAISRKKLRSK